MKRILVALAFAIAAIVGGAIPADAHHTHTPRTICVLLQPHPTTDSENSSFTYLRAPDGHPLRAGCFARHGLGGDLHCYTVSYYSHAWIPNDPAYC